MIPFELTAKFSKLVTKMLQGGITLQEAQTKIAVYQELPCLFRQGTCVTHGNAIEECAKDRE